MREKIGGIDGEYCNYYLNSTRRGRAGQAGEWESGRKLMENIESWAKTDVGFVDAARPSFLFCLTVVRNFSKVTMPCRTPCLRISRKQAKSRKRLVNVADQSDLRVEAKPHKL